MKKKIFALLALFMAVMTASADDNATYYAVDVVSDHGDVTFMVGEDEVTTAKAGDLVSINIDPDRAYRVKEIGAKAYIYWENAKAPLREPVASGATIEVIEVIELTTVDQNTYTFKMPDANVLVELEYLHLLIDDATIEPIADLVYTGEELTPELVVVLDGVTLVEGEDADYTVEYIDNVNAGTATAVVTATGLGNCDGEQTVTFTILKAHPVVVAPEPIEGLVYNSRLQFINTPGSTDGGTMEYSTNNVHFFEDVRYTIHSGTFTVYYRVVGNENYEDDEGGSFEVTVAKAPLIVTADPATKRYGLEDPEFTYTAEGLFVGDGTLNDSMEGSLSREEGEDVGDYALTLGDLTAGDDYEITFNAANLTITPKGVKNVLVMATAAGAGEVPAIIAKDGDKDLAEGEDFDVTYEDGEGKSVSKEEMITTGGSYIAVVTFKSNYTGEKRVDINVEKGDITAISGINAAAKANDSWYDLGGRKLNAKPSQKGIYIVNGKKVQVK